MTAFLGWAALATIAALPHIPWRRQPDPGDQQRRQERDAAIRERADQAQARWDQRQATWQQEAIAGRQRADREAAESAALWAEFDAGERMPGLDSEGRWNG